MDELLEGFVPMEIPERRMGITQKVLNAFLDTGNECMGKKCSNAKEAQKMCRRFYGCLKYYKYPVKVKRRGDVVLLVRGDDQ